jgi:transcriptional regulator with GAF, ATPase, and Fis domain
LKETKNIDELNAKSWALNRKQPLEAIKLANEALALSEKNAYTKGQAEAYKTLGASNVWISNNDLAVENSFKAIELFESISDLKGVAACYYNLGANYSYVSDFDTSIKYYNLCYIKSKEINDEIGMADGLNGLGTIYYRIFENDKALEVLHESEKLCEKHNVLEIYIKVLDGLGEAYYNKKENVKALHYYTKSATISEELGNKQVAAFAIDGLGRTYAALNETDKATFNFEKSLKIRREIGFKPGEVISLYNIGNFYIRLGQIDKGVDYIKDSLKLSESINSKEGIFKAYEVLSKCSELKGNFEESLKYFKLHTKFKEEVISEKSNQVIKSVETQNSLMRSQQEKQLLEAKALELENFSNSLVLMRDVGQQIISSLSVETIVSTAYENINTLMDATGFGIGLINDENTELVFPTFKEGDETYSNVISKLSDSHKPANICFLQKREILINDTDTELEKYTNKKVETSFGKRPLSLIYLPLTYKDKILGVVTVQSFEKNSYTNYHLNILQNIATYTAIAIHNANLYRNQERIVEERTKELRLSKEEIETNFIINQKLSEIGREITSNLDLKSIFKKLHSSLKEIMPADCFGVRIAELETNSINYKYEIENDEVFSDEISVPLTDLNNYTVWCYTNKKDIFLNDNLQEYSKYVKQIKVVSGEMPHSLLFTPLALGDKIFGVITVQSFKKFAYKPEHLQHLKTLSTYTATALENAFLYNNMEQKVEERTKEVVKQKVEIERVAENTKLVGEIGKEITSTLNTKDIIQKVYNSVNKIMDAAMFGIGIYDESKNSLLFSGAIEQNQVLEDYYYNLEDGNRPAVQCFSTQKEYVILNFTEEYVKKTNLTRHSLPGANTESIIYVPITVKSKKIGVITVQSFHTNAYKDYHLQILKNLAVYVAIALDNASLYGTLEERVEERTKEIAKNYQDTRLLGEIAQEISESLSIDRIIEHVYRRINQLMSADAFGIALINKVNNLLEFKNFRENNQIIDDFSIDINDKNRLGTICFNNQKEILINDFALEYTKFITLERKPIKGNDTSSIIYLPLKSKEEIIGVITVQSLSAHAYSNYQVDLLRNITLSIGSAIENASLYSGMEEKVKERTLEVVKQKEEIEKNYENTRLLSEIGKEITSTFSINEIISKVYQSINKIMDATMFGIGIIDSEQEQINFTGAIENGETLPDYFYSLDDEQRPAIITFLSQKDTVISHFTEEYLKTKKVHTRNSLAGQNTESILYVPISLQNKKIGVITVQSFKINAYSDYHLQILKSLAVYAAIALDNASLYNNLENRIKIRTEEIRIAYENTKLLSEIAEDISSSLSVETINEKVYQNINKLMDATMFGIGIYNATSGELEFKGFVENNQLMENFSYKANDPNRLAAKCFSFEKEILISDYSKEYVNYISGIQAPVSGKDSSSIMYLPLYSKQNKIGVITVQSFNPNAYNDYHFNILKNLAVSVGIALDNANLYQNLEEKVAERTREVTKQKEEVERSYENTRLLSKIGNDITSTFSVGEIIEKVYKNVNTLMNAEGFGVGVYLPDKKIVSFPLYIEDNEKLYDIEYAPEDKTRLTSICYSNKQEILINDFSEEIGNYVQIVQAPVQGRRVESIIYVPLLYKDKVTGVVTVQSFNKNAYTDYHLQILKNLAVYIAIALDNASLYTNLDNRVKERTEEIRVAYENTRLLSQIAEDISSSLSVESINAKVYANINKLMSATTIGIGTINEATNQLEFRGFIEDNTTYDLITFDLSDNERLATKCYNEELEIFIKDYQIDYLKYFKKLPESKAGKQASSIIYLPIFSKEKCIGVLTVQSYETNAYSDYQFNLIKNLAVSIGIALDNANLYQNLEHKVEERTLEVTKQKAIIEEKNKDITDSIKYAKKIQQAIVPPIDGLNEYFEESFILYKPKDIVSGDFYWYSRIDDVTIFAAADCTGHGVPGAFMSLICSEIMEKVITDKTIKSPSEALKLIDANLVQLIKKTSETSANDGMDVTLAAYNHKTRLLEMSSAQRPMLLIRNNEIIEYKGTKHSIGGHETIDKNFELISVTIEPDDKLYLLTDGYADQFGGDRGKKYKMKTLKDLILKHHQKPLKLQKRILDLEFESWKGDLEQVDDVCIIGVRF